jgi:hypothetical protein
MSPWATQFIVDLAGIGFGLYLFSPYAIAGAIGLAVAVKAFRAKLKEQ